MHTAAAAGGAAVADWARTEAETEGAPTDAVAAGVGGATAADAMLLGLLLLVCGPLRVPRYTLATLAWYIGVE